jgi:DNA repair photolyase
MGKIKKSHGNMYEWLTHMWSPSVGCPHQCSYCYVKQNKELPETVEMQKPYPPLGSGRTIFVGFECDLFAEGVDEADILGVLIHCSKYDNQYVFQTKNPLRIANSGAILDFFQYHLMYKCLIGTTIETNDDELLKTISKAPSFHQRVNAMIALDNLGFDTFVTIEPVLDFDSWFYSSIVRMHPNFVNIGADSKGHKLPEPSKEKVQALIKYLQDNNIEIRNKANLTRLLT